MSGFRIGDTVNFTTRHSGQKLSGEIVDADIDPTGLKIEYTISVDTPPGPGLLQTTADKMHKTGRNTRGGGR